MYLRFRYQIRYIITNLLFYIVALTSAASGQEGRTIVNINSDWSYLEQNSPNLPSSDGAVLPWQSINLPHTWNKFDATDNNPGYRRDAGWYLKKLIIPDNGKKQVYRLYFEGVNISCEVYINGKKAGGHIGGYVGFYIDITDFVQLDHENMIMVRVDNSINTDIIPSQKSDFFIFGGITRDVWLEILPPAFIDHVTISTPQVSDESAQSNAAILFNNTSKTDKFKVAVEIFDPEGKNISSITEDIVMPSGSSSNRFTLPVVDNPHLWSVSDPALYTVKVTLRSQQYYDSVTERIGFRWFEFAEHGPFYLNGERLILRGTHRHEEHAGLGNAMPDSLHRRDMQMIKEMGANFVRLAHYPQDPEVYRACDELGILVWDELPWCRGGMGGETWKINTRRLFKEQVEQNFNHPSIILWSLGNELYWLPDFSGGDNMDSLRTFLTELNTLAHELDPGRKTAIRKFYEGADIVDVFSPSIWAGWYSGVYKTYEKAIKSAAKKYPRFFHAEYGGSSHVGRHTENPITGEGFVKEDEWAEQPNMINIPRVSSAGDWSENYIVDLFDWHLHITEQADWFTGNAQWAFKDFGTPLRPENAIPYMNQKGLVDRAGRPKDAYYVFKSYWTTSPQFCYIESPTWKIRTGLAGQKKEICVYSNCEQVRLVVNGVDQGIKTRDIKNFPAAGLNWFVALEPGSNVIEAYGYAAGEKVTDHKIDIEYAIEKRGKPEEIILSALKQTDGTYLIEARVVDIKGQLCLEFNQRVYFDHNGAGMLKRYYGTPDGSDVIEFASGLAHIQFIPSGQGQAVIEARTQDFKGSYVWIDCGNDKGIK